MATIRVRVLKTARSTYWYRDYLYATFDVEKEPFNNFGRSSYRVLPTEWNKRFKQLVKNHGIGALMIDASDCIVVNREFENNEEALFLLEED